MYLKDHETTIRHIISKQWLYANVQVNKYHVVISMPNEWTWLQYFDFDDGQPKLCGYILNGIVDNTPEDIHEQCLNVMSKILAKLDFDRTFYVMTSDYGINIAPNPDAGVAFIVAHKVSNVEVIFAKDETEALAKYFAA